MPPSLAPARRLHAPSPHGCSRETSISGMTTMWLRWQPPGTGTWELAGCPPECLWARMHTSPWCVCVWWPQPGLLWTAQGLCKPWPSWFTCVFIHSFGREGEFRDLSRGKLEPYQDQLVQKNPLMAVFIQDDCKGSLIMGTQSYRLPAFLWFPLF